MKIKKSHLYILGTVLILAFAGFALASFQSSLTPYVPFDQARAAERVVQVAGGLAKDSSSYDDTTHSLHFRLVDKESGDTLPVRYQGLKPANFEDAVSIVAIGSYSSDAGTFEAEKLLVKCPSKYQGLEEEGATETKTYS
jgi:cytochrome c-type biogenesis protein CcmE